MYSGSGAQVCANLPLPAFNGQGSNDVHPQYGNGSHPACPNAPYFTPTGFYQYSPQDYRNFSPVDTRYTQHSKNRRHNVFQAPVGPPMPSMNMPSPMNAPPPMNMPPLYVQFNGQFPAFPPSMPHYLPPNGMIMNQFSNPPPPCSPYPPSYPNAKNNNSKNFNGNKFRFSHPTQRKFTQKQTRSFHCGSCDRDFNSASKYEQHVAEHVGCGLDGCTFKAHPAIVEKHVAMQHRNGLFKRIVRGDSPEEIAKWVSDRKKLYPTTERISDKCVQKIEMVERGERYDDRRRGFRNQNNFQNTRTGRKFPYGIRKPFGYHLKRIDSKTKSVDESQTSSGSSKTRRKKRQHSLPLPDNFEFQRNLPAFRGTKYYLQCHTKNNEFDYSNSDSEEESLNVSIASGCDNEVTISDKSSLPISSLQLIMGYDSSDNSIDECDEPTTNAGMKPEPPSLNGGNDDEAGMCSSKLPLFDTLTKSDSNLQIEDDDSGPDECSSKLPVPDFILKDLIESRNNEVSDIESNSPELSMSEPQNKSSLHEKKNNSDTLKRSAMKRVYHKNRNEKADDSAKIVEKKRTFENAEKSEAVTPPLIKRFRRSSLLEKLLEPEIRHERNTILQCIRYVVNNNYFDIGSTPATSTITS